MQTISDTRSSNLNDKRIIIVNRYFVVKYCLYVSRMHAILILIVKEYNNDDNNNNDDDDDDDNNNLTC